MNASAVAKHFDCLTPEERFRLILAASARGDEAERDRLVRMGDRITLSMPQHAPYAHALEELSWLTFVELLEEAALFQDALVRTDETRNAFASDAEEEVEDTSELMDDAEDGRQLEIWDRWYSLALAAGYMLRIKVGGWQLFCKRLGLSPFSLWEGLPGFERLQRTIALTDRIAFTPEGFLRWFNRIRPPGSTEHTEVPLTVEGSADTADKIFRARVEWWRGD